RGFHAPELGHAGLVFGVALEVLAVDEHRLAAEALAARAVLGGRRVGHGFTSGQWIVVSGQWSVVSEDKVITNHRPVPTDHSFGHPPQYFFWPAAVSTARLTATSTSLTL